MTPRQTLADLSPLRPPQLYEQIVERIEDQIRTRALLPGERLPAERDLAGRLEVGRSSVREAVAALATRGIVDTRPGAGSYISQEAPQLVHQEDQSAIADASPSAALEARLALEPQVVRLAARRAVPDPEIERLLELMAAATDSANPSARADWNEADRGFHLQLALMTGNSVLVQLSRTIAALMNEPLWQRLRDESVAEPGRMELHHAEHRQIYEAILAGEEDAAAFYAHEHIRRVRRFMNLDQETL
ncbi:MAG: FadR family transcriptional regulator [Actinobacteria bacterium]|nr:FadR family transcriptional regulator [Actinomycetota bacterium]